MSRWLVAVPVYNEERFLPQVLREIRRYAQDLLVIDDGSTDRTAELLGEQKDVAVIRHAENLGYGQSLIDAFAYAQQQGYDWILTMDADEQHEPHRIPEFRNAAETSRVDILSGSRYLNVTKQDDLPPPDRRSINLVITDLLNTLLGLGMTDSFCGFKAHRVDALRKLKLTEPGYAFPMQFWVQVARASLLVQELPVRRIYHDATRHFGGALDNPQRRLEHYLCVFLQAVRESNTKGLPDQFPTEHRALQIIRQHALPHPNCPIKPALRR